jgi:DNA-3-methyladenine glycosylase
LSFRAKRGIPIASTLLRENLLSRSFFDRDPRIVARELLGKLLVRHERGQFIAGRMVETEAYLGTGDLAAHAAAGRTARNDVLFGPPGHAYVYFIYGNHYLFNVSCLPDSIAGGVLIRALEPVSGIEQMARARGIELPGAKENRTGHSPVPTQRTLRLLTSGPGRLAEALGITRERDNGKDLLNPASDLQIMDDGFRPAKIADTPRVGITKAAEHPFRYVVVGNEFVSGKKTRA